VGYWIGAGSRSVRIELLLEESEKVVVLDLGESRGGTGEIPEGWGSVIHGLARVGKKERRMRGGGRYKENAVRGREWGLS
jgi:hypothetical protein